jgi:hypothetical protein
MVLVCVKLQATMHYFCVYIYIYIFQNMKLISSHHKSNSREESEDCFIFIFVRIFQKKIYSVIYFNLNFVHVCLLNFQALKFVSTRVLVNLVQKTYFCIKIPKTFNELQ